MPRIIIYQRGEFERKIIEEVLKREGIPDFVVVDKFDKIEFLINAEEEQLLFTAKIENPELTRAFVRQLRGISSRLSVVALSAIDLGGGFDRNIVKDPEYLKKVVLTIQEFFHRVRRYGAK